MVRVKFCNKGISKVCAWESKECFIASEHHEFHISEHRPNLAAETHRSSRNPHPGLFKVSDPPRTSNNGTMTARVTVANNKRQSAALWRELGHEGCFPCQKGFPHFAAQIRWQVGNNSVQATSSHRNDS